MVLQVPYFTRARKIDERMAQKLHNFWPQRVPVYGKFWRKGGRRNWGVGGHCPGGWWEVFIPVGGVGTVVVT
jgi:hypothetical protein